MQTLLKEVIEIYHEKYGEYPTSRPTENYFLWYVKDKMTMMAVLMKMNNKQGSFCWVGIPSRCTGISFYKNGIPNEKEFAKDYILKKKLDPNYLQS